MRHVNVLLGVRLGLCKHPRPPHTHTHTPVGVVLQEAMQLVEAGAGHDAEQLGEFALPLIAVLHQGDLERGTIQQDKLDAHHRLLLLNVVGHFHVPENAEMERQMWKREIRISKFQKVKFKTF